MVRESAARLVIPPAAATAGADTAAGVSPYLSPSIAVCPGTISQISPNGSFPRGSIRCVCELMGILDDCLLLTHVCVCFRDCERQQRQQRQHLGAQVGGGFCRTVSCTVEIHSCYYQHSEEQEAK